MHGLRYWRGVEGEEGVVKDTVSRGVPWFNVIVDELEEVKSWLRRLEGHCDVLITTIPS